MNDNDRKKLLLALTKALAGGAQNNKRDEENNQLRLGEVNRLAEQLDVGKQSRDIDPTKALFNLISGLSNKVDALQDEVKYLKHNFENKFREDL